MTKPAAALGEIQTADDLLRERAARGVPGGMWGHLNAVREAASHGFKAVRELDARGNR